MADLIQYETKNDEEELARQLDYCEKVKKLIEAREKELGRRLTACVITFGCQMNARDSEKLIGILQRCGFAMTETEDADFVLYNTCSVRDNANQKVYGRLGVLKGKKSANPEMKIALCGCMTQEQTAVDKIHQSYPFVDLIFGTHNIFCFAEYLYELYRDNKPLTRIIEGTGKIVENLPAERKYPYKSGINIMYGCNNFCSYCIVPYVRGRERSREPEEIIAEIEGLVREGVIEVMLLGQNVNSYGKNLENPISFAKLLQRVEAIQGLERIRFMTSHPKDLSDELIEVMKNSRKICRHLHLPLQSGSDRILKAMNRNYTKAQYITLADKIRREIPDIAITTDIIVGFPGETREDIEDTLDVIRRVGFENAFTFQYSKRTGTPASTMENQVPKDEVQENFDKVLSLVQDTARMQVEKLKDRIMDALVEEINSQDSDYLTGRLSNNILVHFKAPKECIGSIVPVKLCEYKGFYYIGELAEE